MWLLGQKTGIDSNKALRPYCKNLAEGLWNPYYGLKGGRPYDGHCLPKDTEGFLRFAHNNAIEMPVLSAVVNTNQYMEGTFEPAVGPNIHSTTGKKKQSATNLPKIRQKIVNVTNPD